MFDALTPTLIIGQATTFAAAIVTPLEVVVGFAITLILANWVVAKFHRG